MCIASLAPISLQVVVNPLACWTTTTILQSLPHIFCAQGLCRISCKASGQTVSCTAWTGHSAQDVDQLNLKTISGSLEKLYLHQCSPIVPSGELGLGILQKIVSLIARSTSLRVLSLSDQHQDVILPRSAPGPQQSELSDNKDVPHLLLQVHIRRYIVRSIIRTRTFSVWRCLRVSAMSLACQYQSRRGSDNLMTWQLWLLWHCICRGARFEWKCSPTAACIFVCWGV